MAIHAPITSALTRAPLLPYFKLANRAAIGREIERLIELLDRADEPFMDMEDDDPSGDSLDERGEATTDSGTELLRLVPQYAVDQSSGPVNYMAAQKAHYCELMSQP